MEVDKFDVALLAGGTGVVLMNITLFIIYLILRKPRSKRTRGNKSDRPLWIGATIVGGSLWILSSLHVYGSFPQEQNNNYYLVFFKYGLQYTLGFVVFVASVMYRMIRLWQTSVLYMLRPWKPGALNFLLLFPWIILTSIAFAYNEMYTDGLSMMQSSTWSYAMLIFGLVYLLVFIILFGICVGKLWRKLGRMRWHIGLCGAAFGFVGLDALCNLSTLMMRAIPQIVTLFVIVIVLLHTWVIFLSVLEATPRIKSNNNNSCVTFGIFRVDSTGSRFDLQELDPDVRQRVFEIEDQIRKQQHDQREAAADDEKQTFLGKLFQLKQRNMALGDDELDDGFTDVRPYYYLPKDAMILGKARTAESSPDIAYEPCTVYSQFPQVDLDRIFLKKEDIISSKKKAAALEPDLNLNDLEETKKTLRMYQKYFRSAK